MNEYSDRLRERWPRVVTLIGGHPCCLKTTVTQCIATRFDVFGIATHQMGAIRAMWAEEFERQRALRYTRALAIATRATELNLPILVEGTFERLDMRRALWTIATEAKMKFVFIYAMATDSDAVNKRFQHRLHIGRGPDFRANDAAIYYDSLNRYEKPTDEETSAYDGFARIDSATKTSFDRRARGQEIDDILLAIEEAYGEISW
jgi:hypothetical protein